MIADLPPLPDVLNAQTAEAFKSMGSALGAVKATWMRDYAIDEDFRRDMWSEVVRVAEEHNDPGTFTTFVGYEWTGSVGTGWSMIHRNVLYGDGPALTGQTLPFSKLDSDNPEDLWAHLEDYEERLGGNVISIPYNGNLSGGQMFSPSDYEGRPLTPSYARTRARFEPVVEVTQFKGDSEMHPLASPNDTFSDFERSWRTPGATPSSGTQTEPSKKTKTPANAKQPAGEIVASARQSYARSALGIGLDLAAELGVNPFKFGMVGSTDAHTASPRRTRTISGARWASTNPAATARSPVRTMPHRATRRCGRGRTRVVPCSTP